MVQRTSRAGLDGRLLRERQRIASAGENVTGIHTYKHARHYTVLYDSGDLYSMLDTTSTLAAQLPCIVSVIFRPFMASFCMWVRSPSVDIPAVLLSVWLYYYDTSMIRYNTTCILRRGVKPWQQSACLDLRMIRATFRFSNEDVAPAMRHAGRVRGMRAHDHKDSIRKRKVYF